MNEHYRLPCLNCKETHDFIHNKEGDGSVAYAFDCCGCGWRLWVWKDKGRRKTQIEKLTERMAY